MEVGDLALYMSEGVVSYNFFIVVEDHLLQVDHPNAKLYNNHVVGKLLYSSEYGSWSRYCQWSKTKSRVFNCKLIKKLYGIK